ncbi:protein stoned-A [Bacillus rossius redtenbacheri]|uniref:protein stoned-A n=1 Tax=Bacillus rossius redtenbacheri TaxID=93214 RepID=UPI002FDE1242
MHKITKGLKKKKKAKKHKKEQELFDAEELERYRREHQESGSGQQGDGAAADGEAEPDTEEWRRYKALTAGVDSILKKTQGDLDRIKSTSYFQQKPSPGAKPPAAPAAEPADDRKAKRWVGFEDASGGIDDEPEEQHEDAGSPQHAELPGARAEPADEQPLDEDDEEEVDEDIFDTSYVDVVTSGEIKLAYIPDSPADDAADAFDPFDTSIAESVIKEEEQEKAKKKKLVSLGCAVEVLTGKGSRTVTCPPLEAVKKRRAVSRRPQDINLLGSFDEGNAGDVSETAQPTSPPVKSLIDDDNFDHLCTNTSFTSSPCVDLVKTSTPSTTKVSGEVIARSLAEEFELTLTSGVDVPSLVDAEVSRVSPVLAVSSVTAEDDLEDEFAVLAAESAAKSRRESFEPSSDISVAEDPFDTSTVAGAVDINNRQKSGGVTASWDAFNDVSEGIKTEKSVPIKPKPHRPPITYSAQGSLDDKVYNLDNELDSDLSVYAQDPFDTSFAENILPGEIELKLIEKEILDSKDLEINEARILSESDSDFEFNPRDDKLCGLVQSTVSIHVTDPAGEEQGATEDPFDDPGLTSLRPIHRDLLGGSTTDLSTLGHNPIEPSSTTEELITYEEYTDPFDTSTVDVKAAPGKAELKFLEEEILGDVQESLRRSLSDPNFNPRDDEQSTETLESQASADVLPEKPDLLNIHSTSVPHKVVAFDLPTPSSRPDLLSCGKEEGDSFGKPLTPYYADVNVEQLYKVAEEVLEEKVDPFDTSFVEKIAPGKAELKLIENEFVGDVNGLTHSLSDSDFNPRSEEGQSCSPKPQSSTNQLGRRFSDFIGDRKVTPPNSLPIRTTIVTPNVPPIPSAETPPIKPDLLAVEDTSVSTKLLTPAVDKKEIELSDYLDPFDTSIASNLLPGKAELKVLESELVIKETAESSLRRSYTDPDFNPREPKIQEFPESSEKPDLLNITSEGASGVKPLTPLLDKNEDFGTVNNSNHDFDPFDTSLVSNLAPGIVELKILESELIGN